MRDEFNLLPKVSVIMPVYNCEKYVEQAIRSVMAQTFHDWELIVLDDGSSDSTCDIISRLASEDDRIISVPNPENIGVARTRNRAIDISRGEYIALLDSDDVWRCDKLEKQLEKIKSLSADICYSSYAIIDSNGANARKVYSVPEKVSFDELLKENYIGCSTVLLSKHALGNKRFLVDFYHEDYVLWLELLRDGAVAVGCTEPLTEWRLIRDSRSFDKKRSAAHRWNIYRKHLRFSFIKSSLLFVSYAVNGLKKYRK